MAPVGIAREALAGIDQEVVVTFRYPVRFTRGLFQPANPILRDVVQAEGRVVQHPNDGGHELLPLRVPHRHGV
jgi:hypothetical protein